MVKHLIATIVRDSKGMGQESELQFRLRALQRPITARV